MQDEKIIAPTDNQNLFRTKDAIKIAGINLSNNFANRRCFLALAAKLHLSPADERKPEKGGSAEKFWTPEQIAAVKKEHEKTAKPISLDDRANQIRKLSGDTCRNVIEIGKHLTAAKDELPHGDFSAWLKDNFGWTIRTAQNLMAVAERFGDMDIDAFKPSHLQALLALPSGDEQKFIAEQAACGRPVETQSARQLKENIKQHNRQKSKGTKAKTFSHLEPENPVITPFSGAHGALSANTNDTDEAPAVIDVDAAISYSKQKTQSVTIHSVPVKDTTPTSFEVKIVKADIPEHLKKTQYTICTQPQIFSATNSETVTTSGDNTANDSPADETADTLIDSELADIFARIDKITDADKLRRIQAHISERLAEIGKKISLQTPASR